MTFPVEPSRRPVPIHPGELLREDYLPDLSLSVAEFADRLHVSGSQISEVLAEKSAVSPELACRLALFFETTPEFWMNLQTAFELNTIFHGSFDKIRSEVQSRAA